MKEEEEAETNYINRFHKGVDILYDFVLLEYLEISIKNCTMSTLMALLLWIF